MRGDRTIALRRNPANGGIQIFVGNCHVICVGVQEQVRACNPANMPFPEQEITTSAAVRRGEAGERRLLQIAVAGTVGTARAQRDLHKTRAVDPEAGIPAPEIGCSDQRLRDRDGIGRAVCQGARCWLGTNPIEVSVKLPDVPAAHSIAPMLSASRSGDFMSGRG